MLIRVVVLFLLFIAVVAMVQKALRPNRPLGGPGPRAALDRMRCPDCKRINLSQNPAPCARPECGYRK